MSTINTQSNQDVDLHMNVMAAQRNLLEKQLINENRRYHKTGGVSSNNRQTGFLPAFRDESVGSIYLSRFSDGTLAPIHILDGLPEHLGTCDGIAGHPVGSEHKVTSGFVLGGRFFTRAEAARWVGPIVA